jgi:hypothetical protein
MEMSTHQADYRILLPRMTLTLELRSLMLLALVPRTRLHGRAISLKANLLITVISMPTPLYEFGYGLSYTTFALTSNTSASKTVSSSVSPYPGAINSNLALGGNRNLWKTLITASSSVKNTGSISGSAVVQLYVSLPQSVSPQAPQFVSCTDLKRSLLRLARRLPFHFR